MARPGPMGKYYVSGIVDDYCWLINWQMINIRNSVSQDTKSCGRCFPLQADLPYIYIYRLGFRNCLYGHLPGRILQQFCQICWKAVWHFRLWRFIIPQAWCWELSLDTKQDHMLLCAWCWEYNPNFLQTLELCEDIPTNKNTSQRQKSENERIYKYWSPRLFERAAIGSK